MIILVGDKPSKQNKNPNIPFVGTQSYKRLLEWIWHLDIDINEVCLINKASVKAYVAKFPSAKFIAFGTEAKRELTKQGMFAFLLPHPSRLNRKLNDKEWLREQLKACKDWLVLFD